MKKIASTTARAGQSPALSVRCFSAVGKVPVFLLRIRKPVVVTFLVLLTAAMAGHEARAASGMVEFGDVTATKWKAEGGDMKSQLQLADCLVSNDKPKEALYWFQLAAKQGSVEAQARAGQILLFGEIMCNPEQRVLADPARGVRLTHEAATNLNLRACRNMARALQKGLGVKTNLVEAYAWLWLHSAENMPAVRVDLNLLALNLNAEEIRQGQVLARDFRAGKWPALNAAPVKSASAESPAAQVANLPLKVNGISLGGNEALVIINRKTLSEGESARIPVTGGVVNVKCLKISEGAVLIEVEGESEPRLLCVN